MQKISPYLVGESINSIGHFSDDQKHFTSMALSCIVICPEQEIPIRIASFLETARIFKFEGRFSRIEDALKIIIRQSIQFVLVELSLATKVLEELGQFQNNASPKVIILGPEESYFVENGIGDPQIFQNLNEIPQIQENLGRKYAAQNPRKIKIPPSSKGNFDLLKAAQKPVWMLLNPGEWTYELNRENSDIIYVRSEGDIRRVRLSELLVIEAQKDYLKLCTLTESIRILKSMKKIEKFLNPQVHGRIHRSYIVKLNAIHTIDSEFVWLDGIETPIPIGPSYRKELISSLEIL